MKFTAVKADLLEALNQVQGIIATRSTLPILGNVHLACAGGKMTLTTTDLDIYCRVTLAVEGTPEGSTTLPAKRLFAILKAATAPEVKFAVSDKNVTSITCGGSAYKIHGLPAEEFPAFTNNSAPAAALTLPQADLAQIIRKTKCAMSHDETRYVLNGILLVVKDDEVTGVATDGRRLALYPAAVTGAPKECPAESIIPSKAVEHIGRLLGDKGEATIEFAKDSLTVKIGPVEFKTKLIEGNYPNYKQVIPAECKERIALNRETFIGAIRRASLLTSEKSSSIRLTFGKNLLAITSSAPEVGEAREELPIAYKGKEISIAFNPSYLAEPMRALSDDEVFFELVDELAPGVIKTASRYLYVIMPMRLN